jgi:hypothetical protein
VAGTCIAATALCIGTTAAPAGKSERVLITNACWEYKHFRQMDVRGAIVTRLAQSQLICFQPGGLATGASFDVRDGWDWAYRYKIANHAIYLAGEVWGHVLDVDRHRMLVGGLADDPRIYRYVCRTTAESIQCDRLHRRIDR